MTTEWKDVFLAVTHSARSVAGLAKIARRSGVRVLAGSVSTVQITGWHRRPGDNDLVIVESLQGPVPGPGKLSLAPTVTQVRHGRALIKLVNFSPLRKNSQLSIKSPCRKLRRPGRFRRGTST